MHGCESAAVLVNRHVLVSNRWMHCYVLLELGWLMILLGEGSVVGHVEAHMP